MTGVDSAAPAAPVAAAVPALEARGVRVEIGDKTILDAADLTLEAGRLVAVVGPNGAGKSTFARAVAGMQKAAAGEIRWMGDELGSLRGRKLALRRAFVPQRGRVPEGVTVTEAVRIGRSPHLKPLQRPTRHDNEIVAAAMERTGVMRFAERKLTTLSGGELQRVQIAVALAQDAPVLMADEPTSHLDLGATVAVAKLLRGLADEGLAVMLVAHDLSLAAAVADVVVVMSQGNTVAAGPPLATLTHERLEEVWGVDASVQANGHHTALNVAWLGGAGRQRDDS
jgi:iron complex transport system ATP-binding protein